MSEPADPGAASSPAEAVAEAQRLQDRDQPELAAALLDSAWARHPDDPALTKARQATLDGLAVVEHGIRFRYIPAGSFLMGSESGDPDEWPVHEVTLGGFWMAETPMTWARYCALRDWVPPPHGRPKTRPDSRQAAFQLREATKIRLQYCEDQTARARDWHAHDPVTQWRSSDGVKSGQELFGSPDRHDPSSAFAYDTKPIVAASSDEAEQLGALLSTASVTYGLPTEAQWEKAARGGRRGAPYPWGHARPDRSRCDFDHFGDWVIAPCRSLPPNDYGLFGMCGGVWEWTADPYDAQAYQHPDTPAGDPDQPETPTRQRVLRGGSWADCAEVCTVSFRMSRPAGGSRRGHHLSPTLGFRLCRVEAT